MHVLPRSIGREKMPRLTDYLLCFKAALQYQLVHFLDVAGNALRDAGCEIGNDDPRYKSLFRVEGTTSHAYAVSRIPHPA
jgi:hypothetical protein